MYWISECVKYLNSKGFVTTKLVTDSIESKQNLKRRNRFFLYLSIMNHLGADINKQGMDYLAKVFANDIDKTFTISNAKVQLRDTYTRSFSSISPLSILDLVYSIKYKNKGFRVRAIKPTINLDNWFTHIDIVRDEMVESDYVITPKLTEIDVLKKIIRDMTKLLSNKTSKNRDLFNSLFHDDKIRIESRPLNVGVTSDTYRPIIAAINYDAFNYIFFPLEPADLSSIINK